MRPTSTFIKSRLLICILLFFCTFSTFAQTKATVSGILSDSLSKSSVEFATVAIVNAKDTSLISYTLTQKDGAFKLTGLPVDKETRLIISCMGYTTLRRTIVFKPGENKILGTLFLDAKAVKEVTIRGERTPVIMRKDTLEFNAEAFKVRPNAVVEDLLKLLPGLQVNVDGSIVVNGRPVSKMLIDGKRFFGDDPIVGSKNLDAELVDKVQVYDDRDEDPDHKLTEMEVSKIINLKLKSKIKKSTIGKVYGGTGTRGRYEAGGIISTFRDTLQVSAIGLTNNLTHTGFSNADLTGLGGFNRSGGNVQYDGTFGGNGDGGIERMRSAGLNINNDYGKKLKLNFMYFYYNYVKDYNSKSVNEQQLDNTVLTTNNAGISQKRQRRHTASTLVEWNPDSTSNLRFESKLEFSPTSSDGTSNTNTFNTLAPKVNDIFGKTSSASQINEFYDRLIVYHKHKKNAITIFQTADIKNTGSDDFNYNDLESYVSTVPSRVLDRFTTTNQRNYYGELSAALSHEFNKTVTYEIFGQSRYYQTANQLAAFDKSPAGFYDSFVADQSNYTLRDHFIQNFKNTLTFNFEKKARLRVAADLEVQNIINTYHSNVPNLNKWYAYLFPSLNYYNFKKHYSVGYYEMANPPDVYQVQPITRQISTVETLTGNPDLTPGIERHLNLNYNYYNMDKQTYTSFYLSGVVTSNNVVQVSTKDANGFITSTYANKNGGWNAYGSFLKSKDFKKSRIWQFSLYNRIGGGLDQRSFYFNGDEGTQFNYYVNDSQSFNLNYRSIVNLDLTYNISKSITTYRGVDYVSVNTFRHNVITTGMVNWPKHFIFDMQYQYRYNPQIPPGFSKSANIMNLATTYMFMKKDRAQFKLSVYDLLDQNTMVYRYASNNSVTSGENQILKRYFLLTFQYKINTMQTTKK